MVAALIPAAAVAQAQSLERRVAAAPDGEVRLTFAARPGVFGDGEHVIAWDCESGRCRTQRVEGHRRGGWNDRRSACEPGQVRVALSIRGSAVTRVRVYVGGAWSPGPDVTDLDTVGAAEAARYLVALARRAAGDPGKDAVFAAMLADSVAIWPELLALARDAAVPRDTRRAAVFWVGQAAEDAATVGLDELAGTDTVDREVRGAAVFALSQRPRDEGVPALLRIARTHRDPWIRRKAIFWLGQSEDPRALAFFEEVLLRQ
jgi:hypothetical protein